LEWIQAFLDSRAGLWLLCGAVAVWFGIGWWRSYRRRAAARRAKRSFKARAERQWQGHRREGSSVTPLRKK
jgi:uncharacterized membrane protein